MSDEMANLPGTRPNVRQAIPTNFWAVGDYGFTYECTNGCGFWKNVDLGPCRLIGCDGTVVAQRWVRTGPARWHDE